MHTDSALSGFPPLVAERSTLAASDGYSLVLHRTPVEAASIKSRVCLLHGIQSHAGWYGETSRRLAAAGHEPCWLARRGSGDSQVDRGHVPHWERWVSDVRQVIDFLRAQTPRCPTFVLGLSWGGRLAAAFANCYPDCCDGLILLYPALSPKLRVRWWQRAALNLGLAAGQNKRTVPVPLKDPALFTNDRRAQRWIAADPKALHDVTLGFLGANLELQSVLSDVPESLSIPVLMMLAGRDRIVDNERTRVALGRYRHSTTTLIEFPKACHTLEFDDCRDESLNDLIAWLDRRRADWDREEIGRALFAAMMANPGNLACD